jgi:HD-GYP domain-containing protein (c-di-GMP phosphodiesterase class II)
MDRVLVSPLLNDLRNDYFINFCPKREAEYYPITYGECTLWGINTLKGTSAHCSVHNKERENMQYSTASALGNTTDRFATANHLAVVCGAQSTDRADLVASLKKLRRTITGTIQAMALAVESRDRYTAGHQQRVADFAGAVAREFGLSEERIEGVHMAGAVHDLGKISIPAEFLSKTRISDMEYKIIQGHVQAGYDILKEIEFPWPLAQIVLQHHERMDGSGYPHRLSGKEILIEARIIAVADVIEAMASHRPYRAALGIDKALQEVSEKKGVCYDREVVDASVQVIKKGRFTFH